MLSRSRWVFRIIISPIVGLCMFGLGVSPSDARSNAAGWYLRLTEHDLPPWIIHEGVAHFALIVGLLIVLKGVYDLLSLRTEKLVQRPVTPNIPTPFEATDGGKIEIDGGTGYQSLLGFAFAKATRGGSFTMRGATICETDGLLHPKFSQRPYAHKPETEMRTIAASLADRLDRLQQRQFGDLRGGVEIDKTLLRESAELLSELLYRNGPIVRESMDCGMRGGADLAFEGRFAGALLFKGLGDLLMTQADLL